MSCKIGIIIVIIIAIAILLYHVYNQNNSYSYFEPNLNNIPTPPNAPTTPTPPNAPIVPQDEVTMIFESVNNNLSQLYNKLYSLWSYLFEYGTDSFSMTNIHAKNVSRYVADINVYIDKINQMLQNIASGNLLESIRTQCQTDTHVDCPQYILPKNQQGKLYCLQYNITPDCKNKITIIKIIFRRIRNGLGHLNIIIPKIMGQINDIVIPPKLDDFMELQS